MLEIIQGPVYGQYHDSSWPEPMMALFTDV